MKNKSVIALLAGVVLLSVFAAGVYVYNANEAKKLSELVKGTDTVLVRPHSPTQGSKEAKVVLVEFFDPACETCREFYPHVKDIVRESRGKVRLVMRYAAFHQGSDEAVKILEATRKQGLYWQSLDAALKEQPVWASHARPEPQLIWEILFGGGLNIAQAKQDAASPEIAKLLAQDMADVQALNVRQTPSFFVNGRALKNFGLEELKTLVADEIKAQYGS
jgi:protein-disulfide isomerase